MCASQAAEPDAPDPGQVAYPAPACRVLRLFFNEISQSLARLLGLSYRPKR
jgi:hypothetical protein